ncbi:MAG: 4-hydroxy-tetrahydrodipicolinate reductase [Bacteroidetes bacterium]|nr:4-hydroxy-tetrahydrodipicolinate reductase [Bacteroidota bacterium]
MKIALLGYGKMGITIESIAKSEGDEVVMRIDSSNASELTIENLKASDADVAIDFSTPDTAFANISVALKANIPVVSGTTAWLDRLPEVEGLTEETKGAFFYASNFSLGVNIFFHINKVLARIMQGQAAFDVKLTETHHTQKLDAPSGTAISLAKDIISEVSRKDKWVKENAQEQDEIPIASFREKGVPGTHEVTWESPIDELTIKHIAKSREGFARGALLAARWLPGKKGIFGMEDLLKF